MPTWSDIYLETTAESSFDKVRRQYLRELQEYTKRNVIIYYSGWLQKPNVPSYLVGVTELDKHAFMAAVHKLDKSKGLDLILHTPGGEFAVTESLVYYLRQMFGNNIRAIVPQIAMSAGTMIALSCRELIMAKHSCLGPIDPQIGGLSAHAIIEESRRAIEEFGKNQASAIVWNPIMQKYHPTLIGECEKAIQWSSEMTIEWLRTGMYEGETDSTEKIARVVTELGDHSVTYSHARRIAIDRVRELGIKCTALEDDDQLQEAVLNVHHSAMMSFDRSNAVKIVENHLGVAMIRVQQNLVQVQEVR